jgi:DNA repair protein SbcC/Rad50
MIPLKLEIEGFYSYKEKQTINFNELTAAGLFGIFGHVGSGKSSILEAILLALYGSTERLSDKGEKGSMLNLESEQVKLKFEFLAGKNNETRYLSTYLAKRKPKFPEEIKSAEQQLYKLEGENIIPLEDTAEQILGMKKEHFNKTVIIPQGKFSEFLKLGPGPRADMMKELFGLEKYDLSQKTIGLYKKVHGEKEKISAQFTLYENLSMEVLAEKELEFNALKEELQTQELNLKNIQLQLEKLGKAEQLFNQYQSFKGKLSSKSSQVPEMEKLKSRLEKYIKCSLEIHPLIQTRELYSKEFEECSFKITATQSEIEKLDSSLNDLMKEEEKLVQQESKKAEKETKIRDLEMVIQMISLQDALKQIDQKIKDIEGQLTEKNKELEILRNAVSEFEKEKETLNPPNLSLYSTVKSAGSSWLTQTTQYEKLIARIEEIKKEKISLEEQSKSFFKDLPTSFQSLEAYKEHLQYELDSLELKKEEWVQKQGLLNYSHHLHDGEECPLCGSKEHPNPLKSVENEIIEELNKNITWTKAELEKTKESISNQKNILQQLEKNTAHLTTISDDLLGIRVRNIKQQKNPF